MIVPDKKAKFNFTRLELISFELYLLPKKSLRREQDQPEHKADSNF